MKIGRLEFGKWSYKDQQKTWKDYILLSYDKGCCGCHIFTISQFYFTWLIGECYYNYGNNKE